jgi:hypothetical protein
MKHPTRPPGRRHLKVVTDARPPRHPLRRSDRMRLLADQHIRFGIQLYQEAEDVELEELSQP